jgi:hypothetical protein
LDSGSAGKVIGKKMQEQCDPDRLAGLHCSDGVRKAAPRPGRNVHLASLRPSHRSVELVLGIAQVLFGLDSVAFHVVVIGGAGALHLVNGFRDVLMNLVEVVPVANLGRHNRASGECS